MDNNEKRLEVNEMKMLRWMCGVTKKDNIRNVHVRGSVKVAPVTKKITVENGAHTKENVTCTNTVEPLLIDHPQNHIGVVV